MQNDKEEVDLACRGFRNAVQAYCRRYNHTTTADEEEKKNLPKDVEELVNHSSYFLRQLTSKRRSLQNGLDNLRQNLWPQVLDQLQKQRGSGAERASSLLQHFLEQCLRLHDGLLLLVSGECRHPGDVRQAKKQPNQFRSKLKLQRPREDGYTILYNAPGGYSGYGWDEFHDEQVGIKNRLLQALQRYTANGNNKKATRSKERIWDYLLAHGGQAFEAVLDQHESAMINLGFTALKDQVVKDLKLCSARWTTSSTKKNLKVSFVLHDKMEKLQYGDITLERQGDQFQVSDPKGALPNDYTVQHWQQIMKLATPVPNDRSSGQPSLSKERNVVVSQLHHQGHNPNSKNNKMKVTKKRRRIVEDSSDEEEAKKPPSKPKRQQPPTTSTRAKEQLPPTPIVAQKISGLNVKIRKDNNNDNNNKPPTPEGEASSLTRIKAKFGVEGTTLEAAREVLELEEANASKAAKAEEAQAMVITIRQGETNIRNQRRVLQRLLSREKNEQDVFEVWIAREVLREQLMTVGNQILEDCEQETNMDRKQMLITAHKHFQDAKQLVDDQEVLRRSLNQQGKYTTAEARYNARNLLLLQGRAYTNMGATNLDLADVTKRKTNYKTVDSKRYLRLAIEDFAKAKEYAESLRLRSERDRSRVDGSNVVETKTDSVLADQLEVLALRRWGQALWRQGLRQEASDKFGAAASFFPKNPLESFTDNELKSIGLQKALKGLGADCYNAYAEHADLAFAEMVALPPSGGVEEGRELLNKAKQALNAACDLSDAFYNFVGASNVDDDLKQNEIPRRDDIQKLLAEKEEWWNQHQARANRPIAVDTTTNVRNIPLAPRSDVNPHGLQGMPTRRFVVREGSSLRKRKKSKGPNPMYHQHSGELLSALPQYDQSSEDCQLTDEGQQQQYRPWGDELLPGGELQYPSLAPPMPAHIRAQLQSAN